MLIQIDPSSVEVNLSNVLFDPTEELGEGFSRFVSRVVDSIITAADRAVKVATDGMLQALQRPISLDYAKILVDHSNMTFSKVLGREFASVLLGGLVIMVGVIMVNPAVIFSGFAIPALAIADHYLD